MSAQHGLIRVGSKLHAGAEVTLKDRALGSLLLWKPRPGEAFTLVDAAGARFRARLAGLQGGSAVLQVFEAFGTAAKGPHVLLLMALPEKERMETIIEKTTELGVTAILPLKSERSISLAEREARQKKAHKWPEIALRAAKQSRRADIAQVLEYRDFAAALDAPDKTEEDTLKVILHHEDGETEPIKGVLREAAAKKTKNAVILCGPEGGFTSKEAAAAKQKGFTPVTLGPRILRTETAAIIAAGLVIYELEEER